MFHVSAATLLHLSALFLRGRLVPWLTAALFVDEIDAIAPRRTGATIPPFSYYYTHL